MSDSARFRREAKRCHRLAARAADPIDKEALQWMAGEWLKLAYAADPMALPAEMSAVPAKIGLVLSCLLCDDLGWVCENHPDQPWEGPHACSCRGVGAPCPECNPSASDYTAARRL
jgi:hypothetical protein